MNKKTDRPLHGIVVTAKWTEDRQASRKKLTLVVDPEWDEHLTRGKDYQVVTYNRDQTFVKIRDDRGSAVWKKRNCFSG